MTKLSMNRRTFVQTSIAAGVIASLPTRGFAAMHEIKKVGVQLYTVRDDMKKDFAGTVAKVAGVGYKEVEFAGYFDHKPAEIRSMLDKAGLTLRSCHVSYDVVENHWPETLETHHPLGQRFI